MKQYINTNKQKVPGRVRASQEALTLSHSSIMPKLKGIGPLEVLFFIIEPRSLKFGL